jgi:hypothetical protein
MTYEPLALNEQITRRMRQIRAMGFKDQKSSTGSANQAYLQ